jgi:hypothetical protein
MIGEFAPCALTNCLRVADKRISSELFCSSQGRQVDEGKIGSSGPTTRRLRSLCNLQLPSVNENQLLSAFDSELSAITLLV